MTTSGQAARPMMRTVEYDRSCGPQEPEIRTVARPQPGAGEVLVRVHGTSVNPIDVSIRSGGMRIMSGRSVPNGPAGTSPGRWSPPAGA